MAKKIILHDITRHHVSSYTAQRLSETLFNNIKSTVNNAYTELDANTDGSDVVVEVTIVVNDWKENIYVNFKFTWRKFYSNKRKL